ncbi:hypothetical protein BJV74DRAFT_420364 [Russula compacta]|nr:hypothetical protein BJV74DRAFT_420364 [Russula compacta]
MAQDEEKGKATAQAPASSGSPGSDGPSMKMWDLCLTYAEKHDTAMFERWKDDMDGILIYTGIFSATVAAFVIESYKSLKPDPTDVSSQLLQQITQELAGISNGNRFTTPTLDSFKPTRNAIQVNILWFLSLCLSLSCGLAATLVQQWIRRYLRLTRRSESSPLSRVRVRAFLFHGIEEFHIRWVVENVSLMLHVAIFLFFAGLIDFLFPINEEVAHVILAIVVVFGSAYTTLTCLPLIFPHCPYQTPLTSVLWYIGHLLTIAALSLFAYSSHIRAKLDDFRKHVHKGMDVHMLDTVGYKAELDKTALRSTLMMCREESEVEAFVDAIPGYLQIDDNVGTRVDDIGSLLKPKGKEMSLGHRIVHLFTSCVHGHGRLEDVARRCRAITCARAIWEMSRSFLSVRGWNLDMPNLELPRSTGRTLQLLSSDRDEKIAFEALRSGALLERALLEQLSDAEANKDLDKISELEYLLAELIGENDPNMPRYQPGQRNDDRSDGRLIAITEFTSSVLLLIPRLGSPTHADLEATKSTLEELCRGLNCQDFSHAAQERLVGVLAETLAKHSASGSPGTLCPLITRGLEHHQAYIVIPFI